MSGSSPPTYLSFKLDPDPGFVLTIEMMHAEEELGRPFLYDLELTSPTAHCDLLSLLGSAGTVTAQLADGSKRYFNGVVSHAAFRGMVRGAFRYRIELRPWIWLLSQTQDCAIFQNQAVFTTITEGIFRAQGFDAFTDKRQQQAGQTSLDYCVQYRETAFNFVTRLMELYGIYYYFEHTESSHELILADDPNSHSTLSPALPYARNQLEYRKVKDHVWDLTSGLSLQPGKYTHTDYNFTISQSSLLARSIIPAQHPHSTMEVFDYPAAFTDAGSGGTLAQVRMEELAARRQIIGGVTNARGLVVGTRFSLSPLTGEPTITGMDGEYLCISAVTTFGFAEGVADTQGAQTDTYRCEFRAIPATTPYRLPLATRRPFVQGPQNAKVVGASGEEVTTDNFGRIKVKFYWDRSPGEDENSSCWLRVCQPWAGSSWGGMFIPRQGQEVIVSFIEGNPDRPIVTGCVYNDVQPVPYALADNKTRSTIKSNSSKGGGGSNELRFEDLAGSEEVYLHAQKDYHKVVENNDIVDITNDTTTTVKQGKRTVTVQTGDNVLTVSQGNNSATISTGNNSTTVSTGNDSLTVSTGNHSITVSVGSSSITAMQSITLSVGGSSIKIDPTGVTISAPKIAVSGEAQVSVSCPGPVSVSGMPISLN